MKNCTGREIPAEYDRCKRLVSLPIVYVIVNLLYTVDILTMMQDNNAEENSA